MLASAGNNLFYYTFPKDPKHKFEIDFLLSRGSKICPIEVKSSSHASLDAFYDKFSSRIGERILLYTKDLSHDGQTRLIPILMAAFINT